MIERFQYIGREDIMNIFDKNTNILENECEHPRKRMRT